MKLWHLVVSSTVFGLSLSAGVALAQGTTGQTPPQGGAPPSQGGMGQGSGAPKSGAAQGGSDQDGCPMMRNMASLQERVRQLEQRSGVQNPAQPQSRPKAPAGPQRGTGG